MEQELDSENPKREKNFLRYLLGNSYYMKNRRFSDILKDILIFLTVAALMGLLIMLNLKTTEN
jgi:hypothetical protein